MAGLVDGLEFKRTAPSRRERELRESRCYKCYITIQR